MTKTGWLTSLLVLPVILAAAPAGAQDDPMKDPQWSDDPYVQSAPDQEPGTCQGLLERFARPRVEIFERLHQP